MTEWIDVKEKLPEKRTTVLCYFKYEPESPDVVCENTYLGSKLWLSEGSKVTHWQPLPDAPCKTENQFDYGVVTYKHRFSIKRSLDDYEEITLNKCIRMGVQHKYKTMARDKLIAEMQIVYKDDNNKLQCLCLDLHDWTIAIKHIGNMQCNI